MSKKTLPLLLCDFYKVVHSEQYPEGLTRLTSYYTPRMTRVKGLDRVVMFGLQAFIQKYLIEEFDENFFNVPEEEVLEEYNRVLKHSLGDVYNDEKVRKLHKLGYLPLEIRAISEGTLVPIKVPMIEISNTHPEFAWLVNSIETLMSCTLWHTMCAANVGYMYRQIVNKYYEISVEDTIPRNRALGDFGMRGAESLESATKSGAGFCLSFLNTATIPTINYLEEYYYCDTVEDHVAYGAVSTEHSVMCSNFTVDGDEKTMVKRLLTEIYPNNNFSMVSDSYDYWNMVDKILPELKDEILNHNGTLFVRGDSGDPVKIVTETVYRLWNNFGGTINSKGFKVLNSKIRALYGDGITLHRCKQIYEELISKGFACNNVSLGVGSLSMQAIQLEDGTFEPLTRDTFGVAVKATYGEIKGEPISIFKNPKTDNDNFKKSQKGLCKVYRENGVITYRDGYDKYTIQDNLLNKVFIDGEFFRVSSLRGIRNRLHNDKF